MIYTNPRPQHPTTLSMPVRSMNQDYQNTSIYPMQVVICLQSTAAGLNRVYLNCGPSTGEGEQLTCDYAHDATVASGRGTIGFTVLPGYFYNLVLASGAMTVNQWTEWL